MTATNTLSLYNRSFFPTTSSYALLGEYWSDQAKEEGNFPYYNLLKSKDGLVYKIQLATAGFSLEELDVTVHENYLIISGTSKDHSINNYEYITKGISKRNFKRKFTLGEYVNVSTVEYDNGLLTIDLEVILPEEKKPKKITINKK